MNNFEEFQEVLRQYFLRHGVELKMVSNFHDCSANTASGKPVYWYYGTDLTVLNMDLIAKDGYRIIKTGNTESHPVSTADSFLISASNEWYLIEFKDAAINAKADTTKRGVMKKAYENWYMILDILYEMRDQYPMSGFDYLDPVSFARNHVSYILVCSLKKNYELYSKIKNQELTGEHYTPPFMQRLKDYVFKDAYAYTEEHLERKFVDKFTYE